MKQYRPSYYRHFRCIAGACSDNCCIGWEIDIDSASDAFYRSISGQFGCRLQNEIQRDQGGAQFILKGERCPFLNEQNLCDIYIHLGEQALCEICSQHPRYHEWFGDWKESGVGLCCEEAGRLIFSQKAPAAFELVEIQENASEPVDQEAFSALFIARETAFSLVQNRSLPFAQRLALLMNYGDELQSSIDWQDWEQIRFIASDYRDLDVLSAKLPALPALRDCSSMKQLLTYLSQLEPIDPQWPSLLLSIGEQLPKLLSVRNTFCSSWPRWQQDMEQLAVYFLFRYFCKSLFDEDICSKTLLTVCACVIVSLLDTELFQRTGSFSLEDRIFTAKQFSKEIEYCTENLEALWDGFWEKKDLSSSAFLEMILLLFA